MSLVIYKINGIEYQEEIEMYKNRERFFEICNLTDDVRIPSNESFTNRDAYYKSENEGLGYFVTSYCSFDVFKDPETRLLFKKAAEAMEKLENHLNKFEGDEEDED